MNVRGFQMCILMNSSTRDVGPSDVINDDNNNFSVNSRSQSESFFHISGRIA